MMRPIKSQTQVCEFRAKNSGLLKRFSALACSLQRHRFASGFADIQKKIKMR